MTSPLEGILVVDMTRSLAGPYCTMMLGDMGADVIKIERPGKGDDSRAWGPPFVGEESAYFMGVNRNKRSVTLDLRTEFGKQAFLRLVRLADVVVENFKLGSLARLGLDYEDMRDKNPGLIWASISGYGRSGPLADRPGYDLMAQAAGGLMSLTGPKDGEYSKVGIPIVDITTGMYAAYAILAALRTRDNAGTGQRIDLSLFESQLAWLTNVGSLVLIGGMEPKRYGNAHPNIAPYSVFKAKDRKFVLAAANDDQFNTLCTAIDRLDLLTDPRFNTNPNRVVNQDQLNDILNQVFVTKEAEYWVNLFVDLPCAPILTIPEAFQHPQALARDMVLETEHTTAGRIKVAGFPYKLSETPAAIRRPPPTLGQHNEEILVDLLGFDLDELPGSRN